MRILVVDDEIVSRTKLKRLISSFGEPDTAKSGEEALEMFYKGHQEEKPYRLITMDIDMPGLSGQEVVARIRTFEETLKIFAPEDRVRILMVSGMTETKEIMSSFREGCSGFLTKPFNIDSLTETLKKIHFYPLEGKTA